MAFFHTLRLWFYSCLFYQLTIKKIAFLKLWESDVFTVHDYDFIIVHFLEFFYIKNERNKSEFNTFQIRLFNSGETKKRLSRKIFLSEKKHDAWLYSFVKIIQWRNQQKRIKTWDTHLNGSYLILWHSSTLVWITVWAVLSVLYKYSSGTVLLLEFEHLEVTNFRTQEKISSQLRWRARE